MSTFPNNSSDETRVFRSEDDQATQLMPSEAVDEQATRVLPANAIHSTPTATVQVEADEPATRIAEPATSSMVADAPPNQTNFTPVDTTQQLTLRSGMVLKERFVLQEELGVGGMSVVFRARDLRKEEAGDFNSSIAIKVLGGDFMYHPDSFKVLQRESRKAQALAHPNIVSVYDFDRDGNTIYMTMEVLQGQGLDKLIRAHKTTGLPVEQVLLIVEGIAQALAYAHKKGIVHSDLKPGNIFITDNNEVKVLDFGIARACQDGSRNTQDNFDVGQLGALTPAYASKEMFAQAPPAPSDDIYALACISYELLTGKHPFGKKSPIDAEEKGLAPEPITALKPRQWAALKAGLAFNRADRTADVLLFLNGLKPRVIPWKMLAGGAAVMVILAAVGGYYAYQSQQLSATLDDEAARLAPVSLSAEQQKEVADWLELADGYFAMGLLAAPPGDSAFDAYQKVLEIDPRNEKALAAQRQIADTYLEQAQQASQQQNWSAAADLVALGLRVRPSDPDLLELQSIIKAKQ